MLKGFEPPCRAIERARAYEPVAAGLKELLAETCNDVERAQQAHSPDPIPARVPSAKRSSFGRIRNSLRRSFRPAGAALCTEPAPEPPVHTAVHTAPTPPADTTAAAPKCGGGAACQLITWQSDAAAPALDTALVAARSASVTSSIAAQAIAELDEQTVHLHESLAALAAAAEEENAPMGVAMRISVPCGEKVAAMPTESASEPGSPMIRAVGRTLSSVKSFMSDRNKDAPLLTSKSAPPSAMRTPTLDRSLSASCAALPRPCRWQLTTCVRRVQASAATAQTT